MPIAHSSFSRPAQQPGRVVHTGEIVALAGCDLLTISPALLEQLQKSNEPVKQVLSADKAKAEAALPKVSFIDNEPAFRWSLLQDPMSFDKLHEGIKKFAEDAEELKKLLKAKLA
ncbi:hypothetical protein JCM5296_000221 [Sporobolomyces johnsonii]